MALSEPRSIDQFMDLLPIDEVEFFVRENRQVDGQGSGQILETQLAPDLWEARITFRFEYHDQARQTRARLNSLIPIGRSVLIYDMMARYPVADPGGLILAGLDANTLYTHLPWGDEREWRNSIPWNTTPGNIYNASIFSIGSDRDTMRLTGLPAGYIITAGDKIELQYGSPIRRMLLEVSETVTANNSGVTPSFAVYPFIRPGIDTTATVNLIKPVVKMVRTAIEAGSSDPLLHSGMSINLIEKVS